MTREEFERILEWLEKILGEVRRLYDKNKPEGYIPYVATSLKTRYEYDESAAETKIASAMHVVNECYLENCYRVITGESTTLSSGKDFDIAGEVNKMEEMVTKISEKDRFSVAKPSHQPLQSPASTKEVIHKLNDIYQRMMVLERIG